MTERFLRGGLQVAAVLDEVAQEAASGVGVDINKFWASFEDIVTELGPRNRTLLEHRLTLQSQIDDWHLKHPGADYDPKEYALFLRDIGYLLPERETFSISTGEVDEEVSCIAGPQLVVPIMNARYSLNATNARWGSLYDALYGTDAIPTDKGCEITKVFNPTRGREVVSFAKAFLNEHFSLKDGHLHSDVSRYAVRNGGLVVHLVSGGQTGLRDSSQFRGFKGDMEAPSSILLCHNGLHADIIIDRSGSIGATDPAGVQDMILESAVSTIQDCEDSVAAVDAEDKAIVYRNWLGLMRGDLTEEVSKNGVTFTRVLNPDRVYTAPDGGSEISLKGRSLLFIRNTGHLMTNEAVLDSTGREVPEGIMDAMFTGLISMHDLQRNGEGLCNSRKGSVYIVKPKMHGPDEVSLTCDLFDRVEDALGLVRNTLKLGIMDEERRTSVNLKVCPSLSATSEFHQNRSLLSFFLFIECII